MSDRDIIESIRHIAGTHNEDKVFLIAATVDSVNEAARTCDVTTLSSKEEISIPGVRLMPTIDDGILFLPAVGSTIFLTYSNFNVPYVAQFSAIDKVLFIVGDTTLQMIDGKLMLNDGSSGGLVEVENLVKKLNALENLVNDLVSKFNSHTHILSLSSGTGTAAPTAAPETTILTPTNRNDIENTTITHGK
jgi:hypothetical protein